MREDLKKVLAERHLKIGLYLEEVGDHEIWLRRGQKVLAKFSQTGATVESIRAEADKHIS